MPEITQFKNETDVLLFISTHAFFKYVPPFPSCLVQLLMLSSIFEAISSTMMHHLLRRLLKNDCFCDTLTTRSLLFFPPPPHTNPRDFLRNECSHASAATFLFIFDCTHTSTKTVTSPPRRAPKNRNRCESVPPRRPSKLAPLAAKRQKMISGGSFLPD